MGRLIEKAKQAEIGTIATIAYFVFLVLAIVPTAIDSLGISLPSLLLTAYKGGILALLGILLVVLTIKKHAPIRVEVIAFPALFALIYGIYILMFPSFFTFVAPDFTYRPNAEILIQVDMGDRINAMFDVLCLAFFALVSLFFMPNLGLKRRQFFLFGNLLLILVYLCCAYAFIRQYKAILGTDAYITQHPFASIFGNKNTFGVFLMITVFLSAYMFLRSTRLRAKIIYGGSALFFTIVAFLARSSTPAILSFAMIAVFYYRWVLRGFPAKNKKRTILMTVIPPGLVLLTVLFLLITGKGSAIQSLFEKLFKASSADFYHIFSGRGGYWAFGCSIIHPDYLLLGYSQPVLENMIFESVVNIYATRSLTNTYLTALDAYGVFGLALYLLLLVFLFIRIRKIADQSVRFAFFALFFVYVVYSLFESYFVFESKIGSLLLSPILVGVPMTIHHHQEERKRLPIARYVIG